MKMKFKFKLKPFMVALSVALICVIAPIAVKAMVIHGGGAEFGWITHHNYKTGNASVLTTTLKKTDAGDYAYCLEPKKESPDGEDYGVSSKHLSDTYFRVMANGYPNKSFTGDQKKDYYITQVAIWVIDGDYDRSTLTGPYLNYVDQLVKLAKDGNQSSGTFLKFSDKNLTAYLSKDKKSYVTDWIAVEGNNIKGTTTIDVKGAPAGTTLIDNNNLPGNKMQIGQKFYFKIPVESVKTGTQIQFKGTGKYDSHAALCYLSPDSKFQNVSSYVPISVNESTGDYGTITVSPSKGAIKIVKTDATGKKKLAGAVFQVIDKSNNKVMATVTSDGNGQATVNNLLMGEYIIKETKAPVGYEINTATQTTSVKVGETATVNFQDNLTHRQCMLRKIDSETGKPVPGATFELSQNGKVLGTFVSAPNGIVKLGDLNYGTYQVKEIKAPKGYILSDKVFTFDVKETGNGRFEYDAPNTPVRGNVELLKTGDNLAVPSKESKDVKQDKAEVKDTKTETKDAKVEKTETKDVKADMAEAKDVKDTKADAKDAKDTKTDVKEVKKPLAGVKFDLYRVKAKEGENAYLPKSTDKNATKNLLEKPGKIDKDGNQLIGEFLTNNDGKISVPSLLNGDYFFKEVATTEGYVLDQTPIKFTIANNGQTVNVTMQNKTITGKIQITKKDASTGALLPNTTFAIFDNNGKLVVKGKTDKHGIFEFGPLPYGKYYYQEIAAPQGYNIDSRKYPFEIKENGQIVKCEMKDTKIPKTGDVARNPWIPIAGLSTIAVVASAYIFVKKH